MAKRRRFTAKFKAEVVLEALRGESSQVSERLIRTLKAVLLAAPSRDAYGDDN